MRCRSHNIPVALLAACAGVGLGVILSTQNAPHPPTPQTTLLTQYHDQSDKPTERNHPISQLPPEMQKQMEHCIELGTPNEHHKALEHFVGTWDARITHWMPGMSAPMTATGTSTIESVMDGRFVRETFESEMMDMPFKGQMVLGYNNALNRYEAIWYDSFNTAIYSMQGYANQDHSYLTLFTYEPDPISDQTHLIKYVTHIVDNNHSTLTRYRVLPDGSDNKEMLIEYTRQ